ncbi:MAG: sigma-54-dependent Fis family transcriptional regulator [Candidatus Aminicenantes bacterium]|nr:sigma-54-dependent Fis family transcriptional regulator [Candidatus Aminicenantes bacterium]
MSVKKILVIDDDRLIRWTLREKLAAWGYAVSEAETVASGLAAVAADGPDLVLLDVKLPDGRGTDALDEIRRAWPDLPVIMITAFGVIEDVVTAMRRGAYDFVTKPIDDPKLESTLAHALEAASLKKTIAAYKEIERTKLGPERMIGETPAMRETLEMARKVAESETAIVLLQGESGTGKDLLAQTIHLWSRRREAPFLAINCSAIPASLLESELFGYEKGAFTDAKTQKRGLVELADGGTLFLDEISTLDLGLQAKLLRFLETRTFKRVGGLRDIEVDIRVVAATNQDLERLSRDGRFRTDLFYRLHVCPLTLPSLAARRGDIPRLARHFIAHFNRKFNKAIQGLTPEAERVMVEYSWPGNVRELRNAVERAMIFEEGNVISVRHLPIREPAGGGGGVRAGEQPVPGAPMTLPAAEREIVRAALERAGGNVSRAARELGIGRDALRYKIRKFGLGASD